MGGVLCDMYAERIPMTIRRFSSILLILLFPRLLSSPPASMAAQEQGPTPRIRVEVDLVQFNVAVTNNKGDYVTGLRPWDFAVAEDGIAQSLATFAEGDEEPRRVAD